MPWKLVCLWNESTPKLLIWCVRLLTYIMTLLLSLGNLGFPSVACRIKIKKLVKACFELKALLLLKRTVFQGIISTGLLCMLDFITNTWVMMSFICFPSCRSVPDPRSDAVPCWLGFRQGPAVLRTRRGAVPRRSLLHGLGLLHRHGWHCAHLCLRCLLCSGWDRHLQR